MDRQSELLAVEGPVWAKPVVLVPVFGLVSVVAGTLPSFSLSANLLVLGSGGVFCWFGLRHRRHQAQRVAVPVKTAIWLVPFGVLAVVEAVNFLLGSDYSHPTLSRLADPVLEHYFARSGLFFGWLFAFWGLVRR